MHHKHSCCILYMFGYWANPVVRLMSCTAWTINFDWPGWEAMVLKARRFSGDVKSSGTILLFFRRSPVKTFAFSTNLSTMSWVMPVGSDIVADVTCGAEAAGAAAGCWVIPAWGFSVAKASRAAVTSLVRRAITLKWFYTANEEWVIQ